MVNEDQLVSELWAWDVRFLMGRQLSDKPILTPANLIASLAQSGNARMRLSLIPLFLRHPEFSNEVEKADRLLFSQPHQLILRLYFTAAVFLQEKYWDRLEKLFNEQVRLPDLFSQRLGVSSGKDPDETLRNLARHHQLVSGHSINWIGTYEHAAERLIKHMEKFK